MRSQRYYCLHKTASCHY